MTIRIEDGKIKGAVVKMAQFLHGSGRDCKQYPVKVILDGTPLDILIKHALADAIIVLRKRIKNREQAEELENGITFDAMVAAQPRDANSMAMNIDPDELDPQVAEALLKKLMNRQGKDSSAQIVTEE